MAHFPLLRVLLSSLLLVSHGTFSASYTDDDYNNDQIEIVVGENRTIYEYRQNGILTMIKIVPEKGRAYYMVPADGAPHYESLDHKRKLYPQWVIMEW
jgi:hypothetical protein